MASHTLAPFPPELLAAKKQIREQARSYGLDFFPVIFEMCDYEQMNQIAAYGGFPQRYPHWRFGAEYEGLRKRHHYGLGRIYEMGINIDPHSMFMSRGPMEQVKREPKRGAEDEQAGRFKSPKDYLDRWINPPATIEAEQKKLRDEKAKMRHVTPARPTRDVLAYLLEHARLDDWQADCLSIIREESYYFAPQGMTKVMNEGWASYWHSTLMTKHFVEAKEIIDYADHHSGTVHMPPGNFNPYQIGLEIFRDIEDRWNKGKIRKEYEEADTLGQKKRWDKGLGQGRQKIFEVRRVYNEVNFLDEFMP